MYSVRRAKIEDVDSIYSLIRESITVLCSDFYPPDKIESFIKNLPSKAAYYKWLTDKIMIVCCEGNTIVGFGQFDPAESFIDAIYVAPKDTGRGVGSSIINYLEDVTRSLNKSEISIRASINALHFYEKCGYQPQGTTYIQCKDGNRFETIKFCKQLKQAESPVTSPQV